MGGLGDLVGLSLPRCRDYNGDTTGGRGVMPERYQREIEEILRQAGESASVRESEEFGGGPLSGRLSRIRRGIGNRIYPSPGRIMFIGACLLLSAVLVNAIAPGLVGLLGWSGLILFVLAYALFFAKPGFRVEKRWRGRVLEPEENLWDTFQRWMSR